MAKPRLLLFNLVTDVDDPLLGFGTLWLNRIAAHCEYVDVLTMRVGRLDVAENVRVYSVGKERGYGEVRRAAEYYRPLARLTLTRRYDACFAHMMPLFVVLGAPLLKLRGIPVTLWYTHRQETRILRWATAAAWRIVSAVPDSFPIATPKLRVIGHGIDTDFYSPLSTVGARHAAPRQKKRWKIIQVARLTPIKQQETLIRAIAQVDDAQAVFVGGVPPERDATYRDYLESVAAELGVTERVTFTEDLTAEQVRDQYHNATVAVNLSPVGLFDKAALESMAAGITTIVSNPAFDTLLGDDASRLRIAAPDDVAGLGARLRDLLALSDAERRQIGLNLRARVVAAHGLDGLITRLMNVVLYGEP